METEGNIIIKQISIEFINNLYDTGIKHFHELNPSPIIKADILDAAKYIVNQTHKE